MIFGPTLSWKAGSRLPDHALCCEHDLSENRYPLFRIMLGCASLYTECRKKAGKIVGLQLICRIKGGEIGVANVTGWSGKTPIHPTGGNDMGGTGKNNELPSKADRKSKKSPPATT